MNAYTKKKANIETVEEAIRYLGHLCFDVNVIVIAVTYDMTRISEKIEICMAKIHPPLP